MNMNSWLEDIIKSEVKKPMPILSFPSISLMDITVRELISDSSLQAKGMKLVAERTDALASVSMMDLSLEAEAFGADVSFSDNEVPTVTGALVTTPEEAEALEVPGLDKGRCRKYIEAISLAVKEITDRPVFAGVIGPFSLAGRLMDVSEAMVNCYTEPEMVHTVLKKATEFIISYINEYKMSGANGVVMAEPLAGMLSPALAKEFSHDYIKIIVEEIQTEDFILIYHNCGNNVNLMTDSIAETNAAAFHFGNAVNLAEMLELMPKDKLVMGNVDPAGQIRCGTPDSVREETKRIMSECCGYPNFVISSGCDIPPDSSWENIDAFFEAASEFYRFREA